jgi:hypothetical protein
VHASAARTGALLVRLVEAALQESPTP